MQDAFTRVSLLRRPRILARAARLGARNYCRKRDLHRSLGYGSLPRPAEAVIRLMELEEDLNTARKTGEAGYSIIRHVDVLIALAGEAELLRCSGARGREKTAAAAGHRSVQTQDIAPCP